MKPSLYISLIQANLFWESPIENKNHFEKVFSVFFDKKESQQTDLIVLPEMFTTGFTMNTDLAEGFGNSSTLSWLQEQAKKYDVAITGSVIIKQEKEILTEKKKRVEVKFYNRLFFVEPNGYYNYYDKKHLFRMAGEHEVFTAGKNFLVFEYKGWKICPQICYDLRFPVFSRNDLMVDKDGIATSGYDVLLYVANFPAARSLAWNTLLPARAIENSCYCVGVNRTGKDGKGIEYNGDSAIYTPKGEKINSIIQEVEGTEILSYSLSATDLQDYRKKFAVYLDDDEFKLI
ncbi:nitrilase family protein [Bernardetia sp. ABR2-2B]|uniref:nitrilase family protein n=1 Tax=Bernardetia sp. ABR2-2B TaxID=3127472 RepID=UPI0030CF087E